MAAMLCTNHSWPFEKAYTPIYQTFRMFSLHIDAPSHTFSYGGLQCLSESRGGSHETKSIFRICARRYLSLRPCRYLSTVTRSSNQGSVNGFRRERLKRLATFDSLSMQRRLEAKSRVESRTIVC